ncbi:NAD(P)/FAD-dependent oxidoreductase [Larsenimonas suaedae]|uniref:NAD(P)/FAD-dependent oxidoreductase n=1 Tax=Larsenimonas suaedae TaxID=1851019 RepID=A0ABU1GWV8_9GAMM|nr:NAD(P)/FAD-dependent oxidoreductase [Larsenimonas suaedae]MCM2973056.1 NAD(P)/FAD-dependent oxidoreductase [Larsenimonas suaedae]MDR5896493.1 NAD(P)/FAD-dependent oxidoreductase [Larsenimonas suaedae]
MTSTASDSTDIAIIGAGPAGAIAAKCLCDRGFRVRVIEAAQFPRFTIGESLLPQCMEDLAAAGLLDTVNDGGYQRKNGARFSQDEHVVDIDFRDKFSDGPGETFQVERAEFDHRLIQAAIEAGAEVRFGARVNGFTPDANAPSLDITPDDGAPYRLDARFVIDASGPGRVLARLCGLSRDPALSPRTAVFAHLHDNITAPGYDREKILLGAHHSAAERWFWLIPFSNGRASLGFVEPSDRLPQLGDSAEDRYRALWASFPELKRLLEHAELLRTPGEIQGYSANVTALTGPGYAIAGNAGEFLDPIFSSGVTIALRSGRRAAELAARELNGEAVDWRTEYEQPLRHGIDVFRAFVEAWYDGTLQTIIFHPNPPVYLKRMISAVLAGYAWDTANPFVANPRKHLGTLLDLCRKESA